MSQQNHIQQCNIYKLTNILVTVTPVIRCKSKKKKLKISTTAASHGIFCTAVFQTVKYWQDKFNYLPVQKR